MVGSPTAWRAAVGLAAAFVLLLASFAGMLGVSLVSEVCADDTASPTATANHDIPPGYLTAYRAAGSQFGVPWQILAAIGAIESDHGRSRAPGVQSGVNAFGCCAGPMQFNVHDGPPSTWQTYRVDGDGDGATDPYAPADAIASAAHYLKALLERARGDVAGAVYGYNHSQAYVADVLARARAFTHDGNLDATAPASAGMDVAATCARSEETGGAAADLRRAERRS